MLPRSRRRKSSTRATTAASTSRRRSAQHDEHVGRRLQFDVRHDRGPASTPSRQRDRQPIRCKYTVTVGAANTASRRHRRSGAVRYGRKLLLDGGAATSWYVAAICDMDGQGEFEHETFRRSSPAAWVDVPKDLELPANDMKASQRGFASIELMVVVAIIAILSALVIGVNKRTYGASAGTPDPRSAGQRCSMAEARGLLDAALASPDGHAECRDALAVDDDRPGRADCMGARPRDESFAGHTPVWSCSTTV